jgi:DNA-3-methyladenine glycosylase II
MRMDEKQYFEYGATELDYLKSKDPVLGKAIDETGHIYREVIPDMFMALIHAIIGQQISAKAHKTIWLRFLHRCTPITPEHIVSLPVETVQTCGISMKKALYIRNIATDIIDGALDLKTLPTLPDDEVCRRLSQVRGVGVWTAEMLMIFSMQRKDILSWDDMAILRGLRMLYRHQKITPELFATYKKRYSPYATIASLYLWHISIGVNDLLVDPASEPQNDNLTTM